MTSESKPGIYLWRETLYLREAIEEELGRRLRQLVEKDPGLNATLDKVARKEAEPYSSALEFLDASGLSPQWLASLSNERSQRN